MPMLPKNSVDEVLTELSDDEVADCCRYWRWCSDWHRAECEGFSAWKSRIQLSAGYREADRRTLDTDALRASIQKALATRDRRAGLSSQKSYRRGWDPPVGVARSRRGRGRGLVAERPTVPTGLREIGRAASLTGC